MKTLKNQTHGFTLIELLVVIAIIGLLSSVVLASVNSAREKAYIARAQSDLKELQKAMEFLYNDTRYYPNYPARTTPCDNGNEVNLSTAGASIVSNGRSLPGWNGPYVKVPDDPWGTPYYLDGDYRCLSSVIGCNGVDDPSLNSAVLMSCGPNKGCGYDTDNVVIVLCKR